MQMKIVVRLTYIALSFVIVSFLFSCTQETRNEKLRKGRSINFETFLKSDIYFSNSKYIILHIDFADYSTDEVSDYKLIVCNKNLEILGVSNDFRHVVCMKGDTIVCNMLKNKFNIDRSCLPNDLIIRLDSYQEDFRSYGRRKMGKIKHILYNEKNNETILEISDDDTVYPIKKDTIFHIPSNSIHFNKNYFDDYSVYTIVFDSTYLDSNFIQLYAEGSDLQIFQYRKQVWDAIQFQKDR